MQIKFLDRGPHSLSLSEFAEYSGQPEQEIQLYLDAAVQHVEMAVMRSLTNQKIQVVQSGGSFVLPYGPIKKINEITRIDECNKKTPVHINFCRLSGDKIYLPRWDHDWQITYETESIFIGPMEKIKIYELGEMLVNGEKLHHDAIRNCLMHLKSKLSVSVQVDC